LLLLLLLLLLSDAGDTIPGGADTASTDGFAEELTGRASEENEDTVSLFPRLTGDGTAGELPDKEEEEKDADDGVVAPDDFS
jgi:hypothetical protein